MRERTNCQNELIAEGEYLFCVQKSPEKRTNQRGVTFRIWHFSYVGEDNNDHVFQQIMFPWQSRELLLAVGGVEVSPPVIDWDDEEVVGKHVEATVKHAPDKNGVMRTLLVNVRPHDLGVLS